MERSDILIFDIETDSLDVDSAKMKWFGAYSYVDNKYHLLKYTQKEEILSLIKRHSVFVGFNSDSFDIPIIENNGYELIRKNKIDLLDISKKRLPSMKKGCPNYKLKTICNFLDLDEFGKGDIDYKIFQKDEWTQKEETEIKIYLKQDLVLTKKLFEWYSKQFEPLKKYLSFEDQNKLLHIKSSIASLSYRVICNMSGIECEFNDKKIIRKEKFEGGHHIEPRKNRVVGNIVSVDFVSAYPHAIIMNNIISKSNEMGKVEESLKKIFNERLKAKECGDKVKSSAYKIVINSFYGLLGNYAFKNFYNPKDAGATTKYVRDWLKGLAKTLEENGFYVAYGFTDNVMCVIPEWSSKKQLQIIIDKYVNDIKNNVPFPQDTFKLEIEKEMKFIYFFAKNCYLWVDQKNKIKYKSTLLNKNTPRIVMDVFNEYMSKKIIDELDISFTEKELKDKLREFLKNDISGAGEEYNVSELDSYKVKTSLHYQISEKYGPGKHFLIPNTAGVGVGKAKTTKKKIGLRYCTLEEFNENKLTYRDIDISQLIKHLKPFHKTKENKTKTTQKTLK